jgi:hypothetical protein
MASSRQGPGPGNYNPSEKTLALAPSFTMSGNRSKHSKVENPGPGAYNPKVDYAKENLVGGGIKIGTSTRSKLGNDG